MCQRARLMGFAENATVPIQVTGLILAFVVSNWILFRHDPSLRLLTRIILFGIVSAILFSNGSAPFTPTDPGSDRLLTISLSVAKAVWWVLGSACLVSLVRVFLIFERKPREARLLQDLVVAIIYVGTFFSIISYVFSVPVGTMIATSGVFAIILGLALQNTLSDVFSGIALNIARPYSVGDWVTLDNGFEGKVVETNWRATQLLNGSNDLLSIPNSSLAKAQIINLTSPDPEHGTSIRLKLSLATTPKATVDLMEIALRGANSITNSAKSSVKICSLDCEGIELELSFHVASVGNATAARNEVFDLAFRHAKAAGLSIVGGEPPSEPDEVVKSERPLPGTAWRLLNALPLLASLTDDEKEVLSSEMTRRVFRKETVIARQGEILASLLIVRSGIVSIESGGHELLRLSPGDWLGEGGLLTGSEETGTSRAVTTVVAYELSKDSLSALLNERPAIADEIGVILAKRLEQEREHLVSAGPVKPALTIGDRIRIALKISGTI